MAAVDAEASIQPQNATHSRRKRKKGRFIKQGYHKSERDDARRVAARAFLSGITLDSQRQPVAVSSDVSLGLYSPRPSSVASLHSKVLTDDAAIQGGSSVEMELKLYEIQLDFAQQVQQSSFKLITPSKSAVDKTFDASSPVQPYLLNRSASCIESPVTEKSFGFTNPFHERHLAHSRLRSLSFSDSPNLIISCGHSLQPYESFLGNNRVVFTSARGSPFAMFSVLQYRHPREEQLHEWTRARTTSMSLQLELDEFELGTSTTEVSLAFLLAPLWVTQDSPSLSHDPETPTLLRRQSMRRADSDKRSSTPRPLSHYHLNSEDLPSCSRTRGFPGQVFRDHHSATYVLVNYHPLCMDNNEFFVGRNTTTLTPHGYRVSIIQYAQAQDVKKGINDQFSEVFPHIRLTLSKLRSVKHKMYRIGVECDLDLAAVAYAHVYYEKLVLMGKVTKPIRKMVAGACLLLATKFFIDLKRHKIKALIEKITDVFHVSTKELLLYEFPVLAVLQFSLLTPNCQVQAHYDRLRELELS